MRPTRRGKEPCPQGRCQTVARALDQNTPSGGGNCLGSRSEAGGGRQRDRALRIALCFRSSRNQSLKTTVYHGFLGMARPQRAPERPLSASDEEGKRGTGPAKGVCWPQYKEYPNGSGPVGAPARHARVYRMSVSVRSSWTASPLSAIPCSGRLLS